MNQRHTNQELFIHPDLAYEIGIYNKTKETKLKQPKRFFRKSDWERMQDILRSKMNTQ